MSERCLNCNRYPMSDSSYCFEHNPLISDEERRNAKIKGGTHSKRVPLNLDIERFLPITTPEQLNAFYNELLRLCAEEYREDLSGFVRAAVKITPKLSELLAFQSLAALEGRLNEIESRKNGRLLPSRIIDNADTQ